MKDHLYYLMANSSWRQDSGHHYVGIENDPHTEDFQRERFLIRRISALISEDFIRFKPRRRASF